MNLRTDLAIELKENIAAKIDGLEQTLETFSTFNVNRIIVKSKTAQNKLGKKIGTYITFELKRLSQFDNLDEQLHSQLKSELINLIPKEGEILVVGLGNRGVTADALGPKTADQVLATRHIINELRKSTPLENLREISVLCPGVVGQTGVETLEIINSLVNKIKPQCLIVIDALAAINIDRLGNTIQICDTGISPGAGVGNNRKEISKENLNIPVISIGVPTVVDANTLVCSITNSKSDLNNLNSVVAVPTQIDLLIDRAAKIISKAINCALQSKVDEQLILSLV